MAGKRLYTCNYNYFDVIDSEEKAYWLGFIMADGCIQHIVRYRKLVTGSFLQSRKLLKIQLQERDTNHLQKFLSCIEGTYSIKHYFNNGFMSARILIEDNHLFDSLVTLGAVPRKSLVAKFPNIPSDLEMFFIRGYFDGDGCLSKHKTRHNTDEFEFSLVGTREMLEAIIERLPVNHNIKMKQRFPERNVNNWTVKYCGNQQTYKVMSLLYKDAKIYLERKYIKYLELEERVSRLYGKPYRV